ncbi:pyruvate dehydrogenase (acetyl-transferring) E1 component subunit alpha [Candidatus Obscuribacterales bacterium]|nr:pyruvate dehydrogenase (acetyl-transferring) E1 component subunit alpha [Candidatus Obscuribacterales bacterium]MBX3136304.1 pyruvate dehydrogenase (acetyl-transferring) E1 component subunit alpha [Candidatus Obscuribacterales bacterium]MBX3148761.1 pyruvate dehydrogenase (acetyl-transferring) E1 component subunit alpha [Candidatus Obscuribacterales bacterium]
MPRKVLEIEQKIEYLSILDENANVDKELEPDIPAEQLKSMYKYMLLGRRCDERMLKMQRQGRLGTFPQSAGHEAISIGSAINLHQDDWHVPAYRELAGMLYRGWPIENIILYWNGFEEGTAPPEHVNDLPICVPLATQLPHAVGIGMAMNYKKEKNVVMTYFGDGASSEGDCHEALNFASVFKAPVVFVCLNNQYAISVPLSRQMSCETVAQRAIAYNMPGIRVDGNDVLAVYVATKEAVERARAGYGPSLIEGLTYRLTPHTTADDPKKYRSEAETDEWAKKEPLIRFAKYLQNKGVMTAEDLEKMEAEVDNMVKTAVAKAEEMAKSEELLNPFTIIDHVYADMPQFLQEQRDELAELVKREAARKEKKNAKSETGARS